MAYATIAIMNWNVTGSTGRRLPQVEAPFQACISIGKRATIRRHEFPDNTGCFIGLQELAKKANESPTEARNSNRGGPDADSVEPERSALLKHSKHDT